MPPQVKTTRGGVSSTHLWEIISNVERNQERISTILDGVASRVENVERIQVESNRTPWHAIGVAATLIIFTVGGFSTILFYNYSQSVAYLTEASRDQESIIALHTGNGHPATIIEKLETLRGSMNSLESRLDQIVPRSEQERRNDLLDERYHRLSKDIDLLREKTP